MIVRLGLLLLLVGTCLFVRGAGVDADIGGRSYQATGCPELVLNENGPYNIASVHFSSATFRVHPHSCRYVTTDQLDGVPLNRLCKAALTPMDNRAVTRYDRQTHTHTTICTYKIIGLLNWTIHTANSKDIRHTQTDMAVCRVDELCNGCVKGGNKIRAWSTTLRACRCILLISVFLSLLSYVSWLVDSNYTVCALNLIHPNVICDTHFSTLSVDVVICVCSRLIV